MNVVGQGALAICLTGSAALHTDVRLSTGILLTKIFILCSSNRKKYIQFDHLTGYLITNRISPGFTA